MQGDGVGLVTYSGCRGGYSPSLLADACSSLFGQACHLNKRCITKHTLLGHTQTHAGEVFF